MISEKALILCKLGSAGFAVPHVENTPKVSLLKPRPKDMKDRQDRSAFILINLYYEPGGTRCSSTRPLQSPPPPPQPVAAWRVMHRSIPTIIPVTVLAFWIPPVPTPLHRRGPGPEIIILGCRADGTEVSRCWVAGEKIFGD